MSSTNDTSMKDRTVQDLRPYLRQCPTVGSEQHEDYVVADGYLITYEGRPVHGVTGRYMQVEDVHGSYDDVDVEYIMWGQIEVFKRMNNW